MADNNINYIKGNEKRKVPIETVCTEMAQLLQIENLSFLIGAGCSSNIVDGHETGIPGMAAIYKNFIKAFPHFEIAGKNVSGQFDGNIEEMLGVMGAIQATNDITIVDDKIDKKIKCVRNFLRKQIIDGLDGKEVKDIYKNFYTKITQRSRKSPISIFTTNYDLFNEMALDELGFPYNNGFSGTYKRKFSPATYNYMYVENMNLNRDVWERVSSFFNLVKLHGSISWVRKDEQVWERDYENVSDEDTVMIYPTPLKDRSTLMIPYSDLFRTMENRLMQKNSTLVVLGYSFGDDHINRVILNGLAIPTFRLVVFGDSININKLTEMSDTRITVINSDDKIHYFKNIVDKVLPSIHPDIEEEIQTKPINQLIDAFKSEANR